MTKRRGHGEGGIRQRSDGRWEARVDLDKGSDGKRRRRSVYGRTQREVLGEMRRIQRQIEDGLPLMDRRITVDQYLDHWLDVVLPLQGLAHPTIGNYRWAADHVRQNLGQIRLWKLTPDHVEEVIQQKLQAGLSWSSTTRIRAVLVAVLAHGERYGHVSRNAARLVPVPRREPTEGRSMTPDQVKALLEEAPRDRLGAAYVTGALVGLRPGELLGLWWSDIDFDARPPTVTVSRALHLHDGKLLFGEPKTARSRRTVALPARAVVALSQHKRAQALERLQSHAWADPRIVFASSKGTPIEPHNFRRSFRSFTEKCGIGAWTPNELRHTCVSLLAAADVPLNRIADHVGHSGTRMTSGVYRHIVTPSVGADPAAMDRMLG